MALVEDKIAVRFAGLDNKSDEKTVSPPRLITLENAVFTKGLTLSKRNGYRAISTAVIGSASPYSSARKLGVRDDELILFTDSKAYSYAEEIGQWSEIGDMTAVVASERVVAKTGTQQTMPDSAVASGVRALAWEDSAGGVFFTAIEDSSGRLLRPIAQLDANGQRPRCVAVGSVLHIYYAVAALNQIKVAVLNPASITGTVTAAVLVNDLEDSNPSYDAVPTNRTGTPALMAWIRDASGIRIGYVDASGVLGSPVTGHPSVFDGAAGITVTGPIACAYDTDAAATVPVAVSLGMQFVGLETEVISFLTGSLVGGGGTTALHSAAASRLTIEWQRDSISSRRQIWSFWEQSNATDQNRKIDIARYADNNPVTSTLVTQRGMALASRAFQDSDGVYVFGALETTLFSTYFCLRAGASVPLQCVGRLMPGIAGGVPARSHLPSVHVDASDSRVHHWTAVYREILDAESAVFVESGIKIVSMDFDSEQSHQSAQLGRCLYIGGACPKVYDGSILTEAGVHAPPDDIAAPAESVGGSLTTTATYNWIVVPEWVNAQGEIERGPESIPVSKTLTGANNRATLTIPTVRLTAKTNLQLAVYRTEANLETKYFRVSSTNPSVSTGSNRYVANTTTADTVTFVDDMSDAELTTKDELYTVGGILPNNPPPLGAIIAGGKSRLFVNDPADPNLVRFSQQLAIGYSAEFADGLVFGVDPFGGAISGLSAMDDKLIIFKENAIFFVAGDGPLANPDAGGGFTAPVLITSDVGCSNSRSIALTPVGLAFQSSKGIYLLSRDLSVTYIGAPVELYNAQTITSADAVQASHQIRFLTSSGKTLLFDYFHQQWSTFTSHEGFDSVIKDGVYHYLRTDGRVFVETGGAYADGNDQIQMVIETAWIKPGEILQQFQRVWYALIIGQRISAHTFRVYYATNYDTGWVGPFAFDATATPSGGYGDGGYGDGAYGGTLSDLPVFQWRVHVGRNCQAIRFRFEDYQAAGVFGASFELSELVLELGLRKNTFSRGLGNERTK